MKGAFFGPPPLPTGHFLENLTGLSRNTSESSKSIMFSLLTDGGCNSGEKAMQV